MLFGNNWCMNNANIICMNNANIKKTDWSEKKGEIMKSVSMRYARHFIRKEKDII